MKQQWSHFFSIKLILLFAITISVAAIPVAAQKQTNPVDIQVHVRITTETENNDLILYHPDRTLSISDFIGKTDQLSPGVAATYSGIDMEMQGLRKNNVLDIQVKLTIYFDKTRSWMKPEGKTAQVLAHEQIHFDLTAMKACALAMAIQHESYTAGNVQQKIRMLQARHTDELSKLQQAYDKKTEHGTLPEKQAEWAKQVAKEWAKIKCL